MALLDDLLDQARARWGSQRAEALRSLLERTAQDLERIRREDLDLMDDMPLPHPSTAAGVGQAGSG